MDACTQTDSMDITTTITTNLLDLSVSVHLSDIEQDDDFMPLLCCGPKPSSSEPNDHTCVLTEIFGEPEK